MQRLQKAFVDGQKTLIPFVTAGDPDLGSLATLLPAMEQAGARVIEIGIPFSDPVADGPVIQAAMQRALDKGTRLEQIWQVLKETRVQCEAAWVAMVSASCQNE